MQEQPFAIPASFRPAFTAGGTISRSISTLFEKPLLYFGLTFVQIVPMLVVYGILAAVMGVEGLTNAAASGTGYPVWFWVLYIPALLACLVPLAATVHAATEHLVGRDVSFGDSLAVGLQRALPLFAVYFVFSLMIVLGMIALIVPGFILMTAYIVSIPVAVEERRGVLGALGRASALSKGYRTTLFVIGVGFFAISIAVYVGSLLLMFVVGMMMGLVAGPTASVIVTVALASVLYIGLTALFPILLSATYVGLREEKEVGTADQVAGVFS